MCPETRTRQAPDATADAMAVTDSRQVPLESTAQTANMEATTRAKQGDNPIDAPYALHL